MMARKVDVWLPGKGNSNSHGARPVHVIITMIKWIRTSKLSIKNSLSENDGAGRQVETIDSPRQTRKPKMLTVHVTAGAANGSKVQTPKLQIRTSKPGTAGVVCSTNFGALLSKVDGFVPEAQLGNLRIVRQPRKPKMLTVHVTAGAANGSKVRLFFSSLLLSSLELSDPQSL